MRANLRSMRPPTAFDMVRVFDNSPIRSRLPIKYAETKNDAGPTLITSTSPAARRHPPLGGHHYMFRGSQPIDLGTMVSEVELG